MNLKFMGLESLFHDDLCKIEKTIGQKRTSDVCQNDNNNSAFRGSNHVKSVKYMNSHYEDTYMDKDLKIINLSQESITESTLLNSMSNIMITKESVQNVNSTKSSLLKCEDQPLWNVEPKNSVVQPSSNTPQSLSSIRDFM